MQGTSNLYRFALSIKMESIDERRLRAFEYHERIEDVSDSLAQICRKYDMGRYEFDMLLHIQYNKEIRQQPTAKARARRGLEEMGLINSEISYLDRRKRKLRLSEKGRETAERILDEISDMLEEEK